MHSVTHDNLQKADEVTKKSLEKVKQTIQDYLKDNDGQLDEVVHTRLAYAAFDNSLDELIAVSTAETIVQEILSSILNEQQMLIFRLTIGKLSKPQEIDNDKRDIRGSISGSQENSTQGVPPTPPTDTGATPTDSSTDTGSQESSRGNKADEASSTRDKESAGATEATTEVADGKLAVFQGLTKQDIAEERTKPLATINLIKAYFSQKLNKDETKGTNPLVAVTNFMQSLPKTFNQVRAYVSTYLEPNYKITDEQLKHFCVLIP